MVGFGMLTPVAILVVEQLPEHNTGALIQDVTEFIFDDAAIVSCLLRQWGVPTAMIGTAVGDDTRGHALADELEKRGVISQVRFSKEFKTPLEVDVSDRLGARTYFWQREARVLDTLEQADLSLLSGARMLYVDWYDGDHILRAMDEASRLGMSVFLNFEHGHADVNLLHKYASRAFICQAVTDAAQKDCSDPLQVADKLLDQGVQIALITLASEGSLVVTRQQILRIQAPQVTAVDGCGAGATFSAGFIHGHLLGWDLESCARFATAAASLKVTRAGLEMFPESDILAQAKEIQIDNIKRN